MLEDRMPAKSGWIRLCGWVGLVFQTQIWGIAAYEATFKQRVVTAAWPGVLFIASFPLLAIWLLGTIVHAYQRRSAQMLAVQLARALANQGAAVTPLAAVLHGPAPVPTPVCAVCHGRRVIGKRTNVLDPERPCPKCCAAVGA